MTKGNATTAWARGMSHSESRRSRGGSSRAIRNPNPTVTAEVPNGIIKAVSTHCHPEPLDRRDGGAVTEIAPVAAVVVSATAELLVVLSLVETDDERRAGAAMAQAARAPSTTATRVAPTANSNELATASRGGTNEVLPRGLVDRAP
jgi:hypothetical protein